MDKLPVGAFERLAEAMLAWRGRYNQRSYREGRLRELWSLFAEGPQLRSDFVHTRLILDRVINIGVGQEAWFLDCWVLMPRSASLAHGIQIFVCNEGLDEFPITEAAGPFMEKPVSDANEHHFFWVATARGDAQDLPQIAFQCFAPDTISSYNSRPSRSPLSWRFWHLVGLKPNTNKVEVFAQMLLLGLRQDAAGQDAYDSLVRYVGPLTEGADQHVPAAVGHAVTHFLWPHASLGHYIRKVARGLARGNVPSLVVQQLAIQFGISPRTIYRWKASGVTDLVGAAHAFWAKGERVREAHEMAAKLGISLDAARKKVSRASAKRRKAVQQLDEGDAGQPPPAAE